MQRGSETYRAAKFGDDLSAHWKNMTGQMGFMYLMRRNFLV
jgi:hypothetical protein